MKTWVQVQAEKAQKYRAKPQPLSAWDEYYIQMGCEFYLSWDEYNPTTMQFVMDFWQRMGIDVADEILSNGTSYEKLFGWAEMYDNLSDDGQLWVSEKIKNHLLDYIGFDFHPIEEIFDEYWNS